MAKSVKKLIYAACQLKMMLRIRAFKRESFESKKLKEKKELYRACFVEADVDESECIDFDEFFRMRLVRSSSVFLSACCTFDIIIAAAVSSLATSACAEEYCPSR